MSSERVVAAALCAALGLSAVACRSTVRPPDLGGLYDALAQGREIDRNPVIVIPGVMGSTLKQTGSDRTVWGAFTGDYANPGRADGARLLALPMRRGATLSELTDDVYASGALESLQVSFLGLPINVAAYVNLLLALGAGGYKDDAIRYAGGVDYGEGHFTCFQFAYDWRREISENAARFHEFLLEKKAYVEEQFREHFGVEKPDVRFDIVAHSMGGLLARYYARYGGQALADDGAAPELTWAGAENIERLILVAPPNAGSAKSLLNLVHGAQFGFFLPDYPPAVLGTMPSLYELLPRPRHGAYVAAGDHTELVPDALDPGFWERAGWGLADPDQDAVLERLLPDVPDAAERRAIGVDHQRKCLARARQFFRAMDVPAERPDGFEMMVAVGDSVDTPAVLALDARTGGAWTIAHGPGDGTVLRSSALGDERPRGKRDTRLVSPIQWSRATFFFEDHLGLTRDPAFIDNLLYALLEEPRY